MSRTYYDFLHFFCNKGVNQNNLFQASSLLSRDRNQLRTDEVIGGRVRTSDWSSNEANNAANQANQAINPNRRGGRWLIPYQRRKSILMLKDSTLVGNYQQVLFPFKLYLFNCAFCSRVSFGFVLRLLMHTGCKSNHVQLSMLGSKYHQEHLWLVAGTVMAYLINSA